MLVPGVTPKVLTSTVGETRFNGESVPFTWWLFKTLLAFHAFTHTPQQFKVYFLIKNFILVSSVHEVPTLIKHDKHLADNLYCSEDFKAFMTEKQLLLIRNRKFFLKYTTFFVEFLFPFAWRRRHWWTSFHTLEHADEKRRHQKWPVFTFFSHMQIRQKTSRRPSYLP